MKSFSAVTLFCTQVSKVSRTYEFDSIYHVRMRHNALKPKIQHDYQRWGGIFPRLYPLWQYKDLTEKMEDEKILQALKIDV